MKNLILLILLFSGLIAQSQKYPVYNTDRQKVDTLYLEGNILNIKIQNDVKRSLDLSGIAGSTSITGVPLRKVSLAEYNALSTAQIFSDTLWYINPTVPSGYVAQILDGTSNINATNESSVYFNFTGAEPGAGYDYTFSSDGGGSDVIGNGIIQSATDTISGIDLSGLSDGTITLTAFLTNGGGQGANSIDTAAKLTNVPSGYSVVIDQDPIDSGNETAVSFTWTGAEVSATYNYSFASSGGGTDVTGSGTISTATDQITGIDLSGLSDGTITLTAYLTNGSGQGANATDTATKNTVTATNVYTDRAGAAQPDSSTSISSWAGGNATVFSETTTVRTGTTSLGLTSATEDTEQFRQYYFPGTAYDVGNTVTVKGWVYVPTGASASIFLSGGVLSKTDVTTYAGFANDTWSYFEYTGTCTSTSDIMYIYGDSAAAGTGGVFWDDIEVLVE